jgi:hypothetical protein
MIGVPARCAMHQPGSRFLAHASGSAKGRFRYMRDTTMKKSMWAVAALIAAAGATAAIGSAAPDAHADPAPPAACVTPDGQPCAPAPPGCVNPDNSLPCSSSLPDVNAAIRRELQQVLPGLLGR